jgi:hypothetical protein
MKFYCADIQMLMSSWNTLYLLDTLHLLRAGDQAFGIFKYVAKGVGQMSLQLVTVTLHLRFHVREIFQT